MRSVSVLFAALLVTALSATTVLPAPASAESAPFDVHDLVTMRRVSDPQPSPGGKWVPFVLRSTDLEADRGTTDLWLVDNEGQEAPRQITTHEANDWHPRWSADSKFLYFLSTRSGSSQIWRLPLVGGEAQQVSDLPLDVAGFTVSPAGGRLAAAIEVFPDCPDLACTEKRLTERGKSHQSGQLYEQLFVRHWDTWGDGRRSHLFVLGLDDEGKATEAVDVTAGLEANVPSKPFGGMEEVTFTRDGQGLVFTARIAGAGEPWSTNFDLYLVTLDDAGKAGEPRRLTDNPAWDTQPVFSPDGKYLAYLAMRRPGFEADRFRLVLRRWPDGPEQILTEDFDRSVGSFFFNYDTSRVYLTAGDTGAVALYGIELTSGRMIKMIGEGHVYSPGMASDRIVFGYDHLQSPVDLYTIPQNGGELTRITEMNRERLAGIRFGDYEQFSFAGWNGEKVYGFIVKPVDFDPAKKYPIAFLIHGGPQGSFDNDFHYRWNPQVYAGAGYGVVMIDFHGSTGYGQDFTDAIRGDWGGKPLEDLQKGLAAAVAQHPWLDADKACALGASYGGYMINWIAGNWHDFKCLVNHDGLFDLKSMYYSTEELWFPEWEFGGTPWTNPEGYARHNPADHVEKWRTPMLVVHGGLDYRVPLSEGLQTFTALQRRGVPSQLLYFPDENHWVLSPHNSIQWHETVLAWLERWLGEGS